MEAKPVRFKRNPRTRSNLSTGLWILGLLCLFALNQTNYESILPPFIFGTLIVSTMLLFRLSSRGQQYYLQIYGDSMLVYHSLLSGPTSYEISDFQASQETKSLIFRHPGLLITQTNGKKLKLQTWWLTENDVQRIHKMVNKRLAKFAK